ncbi:MAG: hypothetical protein ACODAF_05710, partial [Actinomycetota bacterium]
MQRPEPLPDLDWTTQRAQEFGRSALELWAEYLQKLPGLPVAHPATPAETRAAVSTEVPDEPVDDDTLFACLRTLLLDYGTQTGHGGWMGYISGAGTV